MNNKILFLFFFLIFGTSACSEKIKTNADDDTPTTAVDFIPDSDKDSQESNKPPSANASNFTQIEGAWNSPCEQGSVEYVQRHLNMTNGTFRQENQFHPDSNCTNTTKAPFIIEGTYEIGDDFTTSNGLLTKKIDFIIPSGANKLRLPDIVYIDSANTLYFGVENNAGVRPLVLDLNHAYTK